jgi:hypothetical protein
MSDNSISKRNIALLGLVLLVAVISGFFINYYSAPDEKAEDNANPSIPTEATKQQSDEDKQYREKLAQVLELQRSSSLTETEKTNWEMFKSEKYGFQFQYPKDYLVMGGEELNPSENAGAIFSYSLIQDNERNRSYLAEQTPDAEPPASISVIVYKKDASRINSADWVPTIITPEEKEIPGVYEKTTVSGHEAIVYTSSTMYEYDIVIATNGGYVYSFNVGFTGPEDQIRKDFYRALSTVTFR